MDGWDIRADIDDAYKYLRNHATPLPTIPARFCNRDEEDDEIERSYKKQFFTVLAWIVR
jgi:hypothetical protein